MESLKIVLLCVLSAVVYGILHDQVTARVCVEYFTIGHPPIFETDSPTLIALGWGTIATWWVGFYLSIPAVFLCRLGSWPKLDAARLVRPVVGLMVVTACGSLLAGIAGYLAAKAGWVQFGELIPFLDPPERRIVFLADLWAHLAAYGIGFLGGMVLWGWIVFRRRRMAQQTQP